MQKIVYIFRGSPASGKTSLTKQLAKMLPKPVALLEQDYFRWGIHNFIKPKSKILHSEHKIADNNFMTILKEYLKNEAHTIIIDGPFTWDTEELGYVNSKKINKVANDYGYKCINILLRADKNILVKRNAKRKYSVPKKVFDEMYQIVYKKIDNKELVIDSTKLSKKETLDTLINKLKLS